MQQAKRGFRFKRHRSPVGLDALQQAKGAHNIGLDEIFWAVNGAVYMRLCGKVDNRSGLVCRQQTGHQRSIADVAFYKNMALVTRK